MNAILLCAGFGTRLLPLTEAQPKPLLQVAGKPVLDYLLDQLVGFSQLDAVHVVVNNNHFTQFVAWQQKWKSKIPIHIHNNCVNTVETRRGAIGDLAFVLEKEELHQTPAIVAAGDNILMFDLVPMWKQFHRNQQNLLLSLKSNDPERLKRHGVVTFDQNKRVTGFEEKPTQPKSEWYCPAMYCLASGALQAVFEYRKIAQSQDDIGHFIRFLIERKLFFAYPVEGQRLHIGSLEEYELANHVLKNNYYPS